MIFFTITFEGGSFSLRLLSKVNINACCIVVQSKTKFAVLKHYMLIAGLLCYINIKICFTL